MVKIIKDRHVERFWAFLEYQNQSIAGQSKVQPDFGMAPYTSTLKLKMNLVQEVRISVMLDKFISVRAG